MIDLLKLHSLSFERSSPEHAENRIVLRLATKNGGIRESHLTLREVADLAEDATTIINYCIREKVMLP